MHSREKFGPMSEFVSASRLLEWQASFYCYRLERSARTVPRQSEPAVESRNLLQGRGVDLVDAFAAKGSRVAGKSCRIWKIA